MIRHQTLKAREELLNATYDFQALCKDYGYNKKDVLSASRKKHLVDQRQLIARTLRGMGYSFPIIGQVMNRHHTAIIHLVGVRK